MRRHVIIVLLFILTLSITPKATGPARWWGGGITWFQRPVTEWVAGSYPEIVVVDPDYGPWDTLWRKIDLERIKASGAITLAYLNIGFAEEWRSYWNESWGEDDHPCWLEWVEYPGWPGEYFVKYWHPCAWEEGGWVDILKDEIRKIVEMGFDGVRLDNIDSYTYWEDPDSIGLGGILPQVGNASEWMIYLVGNLSSYAHGLKEDFIVVANMGGGLELLDNQGFLGSIDGVEREEVWYSGDEPVDPVERDEVLNYLRYARDQGKIVYVLDYAWTRSNVEDALSNARAEGFYIYVAPSYDLDSLAPYIPSYNGLSTVETPYGIVVTWSYRGPVNGSWISGYDVYVGKYSSGSITSVKRLTPRDSIDQYPSIAYSPSSNTLLVVYESITGDNVETVKGVLVDPTSLSIIANITVAPGLMPSVSCYNGFFYVFYVNASDRDIHYAIVDGEGNVVGGNILASTGGFDVYPASIGVDEGIAILWYTNTSSSLWIGFLNGSSIVWSNLVDNGVDELRYGITFSSEEGIIVLYQVGNESRAKVYGLDGELKQYITGLPSITWAPAVSYMGDYTVAYMGLGFIECANLSSSSVAEGEWIGYTPTVGSAIHRLGSTLLVLAPSPSGNNTIDVIEVSIPQPIPENGITLIAVIVVSAVIIVILYSIVRRKMGCVVRDV